MQNILNQGGIMMIPLGVCSFLVLFITLERLFVLRKRRLLPSKEFESWRSWFSQPNSNVHRMSVENPAILTQILLPLSNYFPLPPSRLDERVTDLSGKVKHQLERGLVFLDTIAGIAPLFGLLGTAIGMVEVFSNLSGMETVRMNALSFGISQALFTTVAGLMVGIPALIANNLLTRHIDNILVITEDQINALIDEFGSTMMVAP